MTSTELKHQARLQEWAGAIQDCRRSGLSVRQWCRERGTTPTTYYDALPFAAAFDGDCAAILCTSSPAFHAPVPGMAFNPPACLDGYQTIKILQIFWEIFGGGF